MTRTEKENLVPVWERITISLEEAAAYSGIGVRKLRDMTDKPECNYVIWADSQHWKTRCLYVSLMVPREKRKQRSEDYAVSKEGKAADNRSL